MQLGRSIRNTREAIIGILNSSGLPIDVMELILGDVKATVHEQAERELLAAEEQEKAQAMIDKAPPEDKK